MARRRKTKYQWLFNTGTIGPAANIEDTHSGRELTVSAPANGTSAISVADLLLDTPSDEAPVNLPMGVFQNNEYVIKRIVGKCFGAIDQSAAITGGPRRVILTCGIFVARAGDADDGAGAENVPIGFLVGNQAVDNYSPNRAETIREPWVWRRQWILENQVVAAGNPGTASFPTTTAGYGSVADGPHIDAKTGRRVGSDERLFFAASARNFPPNATADDPTIVRVWIDYRVLGAMRRTRGKSAF